MMNQADMVLNHLTTRGPITAMEAMESYGIMRLGARIYDLKCAGFAIKKEMVEDKTAMATRCDMQSTVCKKEVNNHDCVYIHRERNGRTEDECG